MADAIVIKIQLTAGDLNAGKADIRKAVKSALDAAVPDAKEIGQKIGNALSAGIVEGLNKAKQLRTQLDQLLSPTQRLRSEEAQERAHQQRLAEIRERGAQQQAAISARAAAQAERDARRFAEAQERALRRAQPPDSILGFFKRYSSTIREAGESIQQAGYGLLGLTAGVLNVGKAAVTSAVNIDRQVNVLKALTGSAQAAEERFAALVSLSAKTPGLTTSLAATLDAQLRVANVSAGTIDKILPAIGRLNAVSPLGDPQKFGQNLVQLITQGFERPDLKELVGQSPLAGEIIKSIFNVDSPINSKAIKESAQKLGITTTDAFFAAFADAAAKNPKLAGITESLGTQFEKLRDRVIVALRPLGLAIIEALKPLVDSAIPIIEKLSAAFSALPESTKQTILVLAGLTAALGPLVIALGGLIQTLGALGNILTVASGALGAGGAAASGGLIAGLSGVLPVIAAVIAAVGALAAAFATNFGGIRDIAVDAFGFIKSESANAVASLQGVLPSLDSLKSGFQQFSDAVKPLFQDLWEVIKSEAKIGIATATELLKQGIGGLKALGSLAKTAGELLGDNLANGLIGALTAGTAPLFKKLASSEGLSLLLTGGTGPAIKALGRTISGPGNVPDAPRTALPAGSPGDLVRQLEQQQADAQKRRTSPVGGASDSAESKARQLREAQLTQQKLFLEQNERLLVDANKRELEIVKNLYDTKALTAREFYDKKTQLEQSSIQASINATQQEITNAEATLAKTKPGTVERIRLEGELFKLRTDLTIKSREFYASEIENIQATTKALLTQRKELLDDLKQFTVKLDESQLPSAAIKESPSVVEVQAREKIRQVDEIVRAGRVADLELREKELQIQNAISAGVLTEAEGKSATLAIQRQYRDVLIEALRAQQQIEIDPEKLANLRVQIEQLRNLGQELSPTQAFFKGFRSEAETLAESFERIGKSFKDSVLGVVDSGIDKLTKKLGFFKSLVGDILKSLTRVLLGNLLQPSGGGGGGNGVSGFLGRLLNFGGNTGASSVFTGGFAGGGGAGSILGSSANTGGILGALAGAIPSIDVPRSLSLASQGGSGAIGAAKSALGIGGGGSGASGILGSLGTNFSRLFSGIGFGKAPGSGGALAGALPLLGLSLGSSLGTDRLTSILGGAAGGLLGIGLSAAPGIIGAGGALSGLGFLAPLFSNPITAIAAGLALPAVFLLGRARQRKRDEKSSGDFLQDAINQIRDVKKQVESNELTLNVTEARKLFESQILQPFVAQINTLKSKSVRESRLKNQTADLRNLFEKEVIPAVQAQKTRQGINDKLIPEFALGGIVSGLPTPGVDSVLARLSPGEMVLTVRHQQMIQAMAGGNVFAAAGVPNAGQTQSDGSQAFAFGGIATAPVRSVTPTINLTVQLNVSPSEATDILEAAASTDDGQTILVRARKVAALNGIGRTRG